MLFSRRAVSETLVWSLMIVEVEVGSQASLQMVSCVILFKIDVLIFYATPYAFTEDVVKGDSIYDVICGVIIGTKHMLVDSHRTAVDW